MRLLWISSVVILGIFLAPISHAVDAEWWDSDWEYRLLLRIVPEERRGDINTARVNLAEQSSYCSDEGRDIRVVDGNNNRVPSTVETKEKGLLVLFKVDPDENNYYLYYGNPEADALDDEWEQKTGGLTLETREAPRRSYRAEALPEMAREDTRTYGRDAWPQINEVDNPFGPDDGYISVYEGTIHCPEDGEYTFAINADDMAMFRLYRGEKKVLQLHRDGGVPSEEWRDPQHSGAIGSTDKPLKAGVYRIRYLHLENTGAQLAKLGWETPSSDEIGTIPPRAFVKHLPVELRGRQKTGRELNPFFSAKHLYNLVVNDGGAEFPYYEFESLTETNDSELSYTWDFGDGNQADGRKLRHEFPRKKPHDVTLTVETSDGRSESVTRRVMPDDEPVKSMSLEMELHSEMGMPVLPAGHSAQLELFLKNISSVERSFTLQTLTGDNEPEKLKDEQRITGLTPSKPGPEDWQTVRKSLQLPSHNYDVTYRLMLHGQPVATREIAVMGTDRPLADLHLDSAGNIRDSRDRMVLLRLADVKPDNDGQRELGGATDTIQILILEDRMTRRRGNQSREYPELLRRRLSDLYPELSFDLSFGGCGDAESNSLTERFLNVCRILEKTEPDIVIWAARPESVLNTVPPASYEAYLVATMDQIISATRAHILLTTPPPLPRNPKRSLPYSTIVKQTGLRKAAMVSDIYSRMLLIDGWKEMFKPYGSKRPAYNLHPGPDGEAVIAREISNTIIDHLHEQLSRANRQVRFDSD